MKTNDTNKIVYPELSYKITGLLFKVHNELGRFCREKQYADVIKSAFQQNHIDYKREEPIARIHIANKRTNIADFVICDRILLDIKAKLVVTKEDYYQIGW